MAADEKEPDPEGVVRTDQEDDDEDEEEAPSPPRTRARRNAPSTTPPSSSSTSLYRCPWDDYSAEKPESLEGHMHKKHPEKFKVVTASPSPQGSGTVQPGSQGPPARSLTAPIVVGQEGSPEERLKKILGMMRIDPDVADFINEYWSTTPQIQSWWGLHQLCMNLKGTGGAPGSAQIANYVFGGQGGATGGPQPFWGAFAGGGMPGALPGQAPQIYTAQQLGEAPSRTAGSKESIEDMTRRAMEEMIAWTRIRNMGAATPGGADRPFVLEMRPKIGPDGKVVYDAGGSPVMDYIPRTAVAADAAQMIQQYQKGESLDPTKVMMTMVEMFKTGVQLRSEVEPKSSGGGVDADRVFAMQEKVAAAQLEALKARWESTEKLFDQERATFQRQIEQLSPERQAEQIEKWKKLGFLGGDNLEAAKLQLRLKMWESQREDEKDARMMEIQARMEESAKGRETFASLIDLGKTALTDALKPVTSAIGDGLRENIARGHGLAPPTGGNPAPAPAAAPDYASMTPEQRAQYRQRFAELKQKLESEEARLSQAGG